MDRRFKGAGIGLLAFALACASTSHAKSAKPDQVIHFSHPHGFYERPIQLLIKPSSPAGRVYFTTNGEIPTLASGSRYEGPVTISSTMVVRARTFDEHSFGGQVDTRTYIFPEQVSGQTGGDLPQTWGTRNGQPVPAHYKMASGIINDPHYSNALPAALKSIPTLSIVMRPADLFESKGIYANPQETGSESERQASAELIDPNRGAGFEINCGIRVQGGWNRRPEESPKHSFRLVFRKKYGTEFLEFPLFGKSAKYETIILRGGNNNSWLHWSGAERRRGEFIRDQWMRETASAMGLASARGSFVHLYLNGLYWGLYNLCERPSAGLAARHFGGAPEDYDSRNADKILEGDDAAWKELMRIANGGQLQSLRDLVDLSAFADYMIANLYGANADWDRSSNWYAARRREPPGKFYFFIWDGERTLEGINDNAIKWDDDQSPMRLFQKLRGDAEFRLLFADRVRRHFFDEGCLTPGAAAARFQHWATNIEAAVIGEAGRWGDYRLNVHPYKTAPYEAYSPEHWRAEVERLLTQYFPERTAAALKQFREAGLYPKVDAPAGNKVNGTLTLTAGRGTIYFTTDGSDPRLPGGRVSPSARKFESAVDSPKGAKARVLHGDAVSGEWSALAEF